MGNRALKGALRGHVRVHLAGDALILVIYHESSAGIIFQTRAGGLLGASIFGGSFKRQGRL